MEFLKRNGYITLLNPSMDVEPLQLLIRISNGQVEGLHASVQDLFIPHDLPLPLVSKDIEMSEISGREKVDYNVSANLSVMQHLWKWCSGKDELSLQLERNREISFVLDKPIKNYVNIILLNAFLQDAHWNAITGDLKKKIIEGELYVITETLKSDKFSFVVSGSSSSHAAVKAPAEVVTASGEFGQRQEALLEKKYEGNAPMVLGIKASKIYYSKPHLFSSRDAHVSLSPQHNITVFRGEDDFPAVLLEDTYCQI